MGLLPLVYRCMLVGPSSMGLLAPAVHCMLVGAGPAHSPAWVQHHTANSNYLGARQSCQHLAESACLGWLAVPGCPAQDLHTAGLPVLPAACLCSQVPAAHLAPPAPAVFVAVSHWMHNAMSQSLLDDAEDAALKLGMHIRLPVLSNDFLHFVAMEVSIADITLSRSASGGAGQGCDRIAQ